jgi:N-acetylglucosamine malate deacetylase 1
VKILAIGAHPDDLELLCAGTLAKLAKLGHQIVMAHVTTGDKGGNLTREELAQIRGEEAKVSANIIGANSLGGICGDLELYNSHEFKEKMINTILEIRPALIITHAGNDYHPDHRITCELVLEAVSQIRLNKENLNQADYNFKEVSIWYMDTVAGIDCTPEEYVDITNTIDIKQQMIKCHKSQMEWMSSYRHSDMTYVIEWMGRWRGKQSGVAFAEVFTIDAACNRFRPSDLLKLN